MLNTIKKFAENFLEQIENKDNNKEVCIISHFDTDGITSAAILAKTLKKLDKKFSIKIVKQLEREVIEKFIQDNKERLIVFLDLGSSSLPYLSKLSIELNTEIFILDHHEINHVSHVTEMPKNMHFVNTHIFKEEEVSGAGLTYLFVKELLKEKDVIKDNEFSELSNLAVVGMVGDMLEREISKINNTILNDAGCVVKKGLLLFPSTRPVHKTLEFSSGIFIPGVTGSARGSISLLKEAGIEKNNGTYKSLIELEKDEMSKLITAMLLRLPNKEIHEKIIGNIYLVKLFNRLEDAREISTMINACSRLGYSEIAIALCMGNKKAKEMAEEIYTKYKQHLVSALTYIQQSNHFQSRGYVIINAKNQIKDTIIGTVASILAKSQTYEDGTVIIAMAYIQDSKPDKIKISARIVGKNEKNERNVREILESVVESIGGECGGHSASAGCLISKESEKEFLELIKKRLEIEQIKIRR